MAGRVHASEIRRRMSETLDHLGDPGTWVIVTRRGKDAAALVSLDLFWKLLDRRAGQPAPDDPGGHAPIMRSTGLETAAAGVPESKSATDPDDDGSGNADDLMQRIEATRREVGLAPYRGND